MGYKILFALTSYVRSQPYDIITFIRMSRGNIVNGSLNGQQRKKTKSKHILSQIMKTPNYEHIFLDTYKPNSSITSNF